MSYNQGAGQPPQPQLPPQGPPPPYQYQPTYGVAPPGYPTASQPPPYGQVAPQAAIYYNPAPPGGGGFTPYMPSPQQQPYYPHQWQAAPQQMPPQRPQNVTVHGGFDSSARFDGASQANIPPPPPGCPPNPAQMAMAQGHNVTVTQRKWNSWEGGGSGNGWVLF